jgi:hypothetical protein
MRFQTNSTYRSKWDAVGISASLLCTVHCVVLPFFLSSLPFLGIELLRSRLFESLTIGTSLLAGCWALSGGYRRRHHRLWPVFLFAAGMLVLLAGNLFFTNRLLELGSKLVAAVCIITAHMFNWKYGKAPKLRIVPPNTDPL